MFLMPDKYYKVEEERKSIEESTSKMVQEVITKINDILKIVEKEVETNIDWDTMMEYAPALLNINADNIKTGMLPGTAQYCNGVAVYLVDEDESKELVNELFLTPSSTSNEEENTVSNEVADEVSTETTTTKKNFTVEILNGTGSQTKLNQAITQLESQGYKISKKGNTNITSETTIINRTNNKAQEENSLIALLGTGTSVMGEDNSNVDFTIILGSDY